MPLRNKGSNLWFPPNAPSLRFGDVRERRGSHGHIGKRVFVVWNEWEPYTGTVTKHDPFKSHSLFVEYDDGEKQWEAAEDVRPIDEFIVLE